MKHKIRFDERIVNDVVPSDDTWNNTFISELKKWREFNVVSV